VKKVDVKLKVLEAVDAHGLLCHDQLVEALKLDLSAVEVAVDQCVFDSYLTWESHGDKFFYRLTSNGYDFLEEKKRKEVL
jgi:hypothetical protein